MNTSARVIPLLKETRSRDYVFILEDLELAFPKEQISQITKDWNGGMDIEEIAETQKRKPEEIFLALFHQAIRNRIIRPFAGRL